MVVTVATVFHDWLYEVSGNPMNPAYIPSLFSTYSQRMNFKERLSNFLMTNYLSWQMHYHSNSQLEFVKEHFDIELPHIKDLYKDISLYLVNSHHSLNGIRPTTTNVIEIGGLHLKDNDKLPSPVCSNENHFSQCVLSEFNENQNHFLLLVYFFLSFKIKS